MKSRFNVPVTLLLAVLLAGGAVTAVLKQNAIARLRTDNQPLVEQGREAERLARENQDIPRLLQAVTEADKHQADNAELLRLRNEATQLRGQATELAALQAENQRLVAQGKRIVVPSNRQEAAALPDFVPKASLRDTGLASPEATIQTFLWSMSQGDINRLQQCVLPGGLPPEAFSESNRKDMLKTGQSLVGFRITERKDISPEEVLLGVFVIGMSSAEEGEVAPMTLKRIGNEWKMTMAAPGK